MAARAAASRKPKAKRSKQTTAEPPQEHSPADLVDTQLAKYRSMRDFEITAEPSGALPSRTPARPAATRAKPGEGLPFVIQKHAASHLHYDFRLGWSGVLKSWAVAKGPSYVTADRRLAVQVEDHPMEYGGFEGVIPKGQYGGGTVMVWDQGVWWPQPGHENVEAGLRTGSLKFELHGAKLQGKWTLVRMHTTHPYPGENGRWKSNDKPQWLLIKEHDAFERPASAPAIVEESADSALTGRSMEQIAEESDHVWNSKETAGTGQAWYRTSDAHRDADSGAPATPPSPKDMKDVALRVAGRPRAAAKPGPAPRTATGLSPRASNLLDELPREPQPEFLAPQLAQEAEGPPEGADWLHELKLDGYRMQARKSARGVQMLTRSGLDWTYRVPAVAEAVSQLAIGAAT
ncbi:MAG: hypothetical protein INR62_10645, partial [Rhodospirillales bacterium]|nr:hypothetical protein [Acetobacter sp.]